MTHGKGKKGGRGAGLRGGRGNAGLNKHKFMHMVKYMPDHFGRYGFKRPRSVVKKDKTINVGQLGEKFPGKKVINLTEEGFDKLLGGGDITTGLKITVNSASEKAIEKIKEKGGEVILIEPKFEEQTTADETSEEEDIEEKTFERPIEKEVEEQAEKKQEKS